MKFLRLTFRCQSCDEKISRDVLAETTNALSRNLSEVISLRCKCGRIGRFEIEGCKLVSYKPEK